MNFEENDLSWMEEENRKFAEDPNCKNEEMFNFDLPEFPLLQQSHYEEFSPSHSLQISPMPLFSLKQVEDDCSLIKAAHLQSSNNAPIPLVLKDNFSSRGGVCTATEKAGKQFKLSILNEELKMATFHLETYPIFQKTQWPGTEGVEWLDYNMQNVQHVMGENDYSVTIEVIGVAQDGSETVKIEKCKNQLCRSSKPLSSLEPGQEGLPLCFFSKKQAKGIKFNGVTPFIPLGFRCAPSYHDCVSFRLRITLKNEQGTTFYAERPVPFLQSKTKERKSAPDSAQPNHRPAKRSRTAAELNEPDEESCSPSLSSSATVSISSEPVDSPRVPLRLSQLHPAHGPAAGGTWLTIEGTGFTENSKILFSHWSSPVETFRLNGSCSKLVCQNPPGRAGETVQVSVVDCGAKSNELPFQYDGADQLQKATMLKLQNILESVKSSGSGMSQAPPGGSSSGSSGGGNVSSTFGSGTNYFSNRSKQVDDSTSKDGLSMLSMLQLLYTLLQTLLTFGDGGTKEAATSPPRTRVRGGKSAPQATNALRCGGSAEQPEALATSATRWEGPTKTPPTKTPPTTTQPANDYFSYENDLELFSQVSQVISDLSNVEFCSLFSLPPSPQADTSSTLQTEDIFFDSTRQQTDGLQPEAQPLDHETGKMVLWGRTFASPSDEHLQFDHSPNTSHNDRNQNSSQSPFTIQIRNHTSFSAHPAEREQQCSGDVQSAQHSPLQKQQGCSNSHDKMDFDDDVTNPHFYGNIQKSPDGSMIQMSTSPNSQSNRACGSSPQQQQGSRDDASQNSGMPSKFSQPQGGNSPFTASSPSEYQPKGNLFDTHPAKQPLYVDLADEGEGSPLSVQANVKLTRKREREPPLQDRYREQELQESGVLQEDASASQSAMKKRKDGGGTLQDLSLQNDSSCSGQVLQMDHQVLQESDIIQKQHLRVSGFMGTGHFSVVWKGNCFDKPVAIKLVKSTDSQDFLKEAQILKTLHHHPNILGFVGICPTPPALVTELMPRGDLRSFLLSSPTQMDEKLAFQVCRDICVGMHFLHNNFVLHRDLAARNILVDPPSETNPRPTFKIADFGRSLIVDDPSTTVIDTSKKGPLKWMAPESLSRREFSFKSDVWSFGVVLYELFTNGQEPYSNMSSVEAASRVITSGLKPTLPPSSPSFFEKMLGECTNQSPENRPHFLQLLNGLDSVYQEKDTSGNSQDVIEINMKDVTMIQYLGSGSFGRIFQATFNGTPVVVKSLNAKVQSKETKSTLLKLFPNDQPMVLPEQLVRLYGFFEIENDLHIVSEYLAPPYQPLSTYLETERNSVMRLASFDNKLKIALEIAKSMVFLHNLGIAHQDLKPNNVFVDLSSFSEQKLRVKIGDFGLSVREPARHLDPKYVAPELNGTSDFDLSADVWSFGTLLDEMVSTTPIGNPETAPNRQMVSQLVSKCHDPVAGNRPSFATIVQELENFFGSAL